MNICSIQHNKSFDEHVSKQFITVYNCDLYKIKSSAFMSLYLEYRHDCMNCGTVLKSNHRQSLVLALSIKHDQKQMTTSFR